MEENERNYESRLDKIFAHGALWRHRTLRTVLDPGSSEWEQTDFRQKIEILKKIVQSEEKLRRIIRLYKVRYEEQNRRTISLNVENALIFLIEYILKNQLEENNQ